VYRGSGWNAIAFPNHVTLLTLLHAKRNIFLKKSSGVYDNYAIITTTSIVLSWLRRIKDLRNTRGWVCATNASPRAPKVTISQLSIHTACCDPLGLIQAPNSLSLYVHGKSYSINKDVFPPFVHVRAQKAHVKATLENVQFTLLGFRTSTQDFTEVHSVTNPTQSRRMHRVGVEPHADGQARHT
jgi:hypothetical protein